MIEERLIPKRRFKEFVNTGAWEQRKLGEVLADMYNGQTPYRLNEDNWNGNINWLSSGELNRGVVTKTVEKITPQGQKDANLKLIPKGTFIIAITGLEASGTRGNCAILGLDTTMNQSCMALFPVKELLDSRFLFQWYRKVSEKYGISYTQGTKQQSYNAEIIKLLPINLPSLKEQNKISQFLFDLDNLITLHQRKLGKIKSMKKAYLHELFPTDGNRIPKRRFKGFSDDWEQRKFSDITYLAGEKNRENLPYQSYSISNEKGFVPQDEQFENGGTMREADKSMYIIVQPNSFAYNPARINVGSIGYYNLPNNVIVSSLYEVFKTSDDIDDRFLWHWFKSDLFPQFIERYQEGGVRMYFYYNKLCMCSLYLPKIEEQRRISAYFDRLDNLIALHQRKLEKLQNLKKAYLNEMFV